MTVPRSEPALEAFLSALLEDDPEQLYDRAPCGYLSTTPDGTIVKVNATFLTWTGHLAEDLVGKRRFVELLTAGGRIYHETHYAPMLRMQDSVRELALDLVRRDGRRLPVLVNASLERGSDGEPRVVRIAVFDATERREYERELLRAKQRAEESEARASRLARTLQQTLIPPAPPDIPGLRLSAVYRPASEGVDVGGDFYDVFQLGRDDWMVVLGDICGKGVDAAVVTALARYTVRAVAAATPEPRAVLHGLNEVLLHDETDRFCTVVLLRLRRGPDGWSTTMASGGHPLPVLVSPGRPARPVGDSGPLIGVLEGVDWTDHALALPRGSSLVLYTDGITEARRDGGFFGDERLLGSLTRHADAGGGLVEGLLADVDSYQGDRQTDDIAVVAVDVPTDGG